MYLRYIFVFVLIAIGVAYATQGPFYVLLFYLWNAYFRPELWVWGNLIATLNLSFTIGLFLVVATAFSMPKIPLNARTGLVLLFAFDTFMSTLTSEHPNVSWEAWTEFAKVLLISFLIVVLVTDRRRFRLTLLMMAYSLGFECAKQGWATTILHPGARNDNIIGFLGDNNGVALGTMMLVPIFGALAQTASSRREAYLHRFFLVGVFLRGITTYSRGGFLAASIIGLVGLLRSPRKIRYVISIALVVGIVVAVMPDQFWDRMATINAPAEDRDGSMRGRLHFWKVGATMAAANPLTGVGFAAYQSSYLSYNTDLEFTRQRAAHSVWFGALGELGYPGFTLFVTIVSLAMWSCWRVSVSSKRDDTRSELGIYASGLLTSLIAFAVAGSFLSHQYYEMPWHFIGLATTLHLLATRAEPVAARAPSEPARIQAAYVR